MKAAIVGHFAYGKTFLDGQTVKTHSIDKAVRERYGTDEVCTVDTHGIKKKILALPFMLMKALKSSENVIILPAHNGVRVIVPLLKFLNKIYRRKLHYCVVGGWLPSFLEGKRGLEKQLKSFDGIYVETNTMLRALEARGFENVHLLPNFKDLKILDSSEMCSEYKEPYKLVTFSRVMKQKGIEDAVNAVKTVNESLGREVFNLDIYGPVDSAETEWFDGMSAEFPAGVSYKGLVPYEESVGVLKDYFALLFPTRFYTEGVPGTIIDAYAAGLPVISSRWESFADVVDDGVTGISYEFGNYDDLVSRLFEIADNPKIVTSKKESCLEKAYQFTADVAMDELVRRM
jgi:glycosyltransferase involved in cell wall biosynthesis